MASTTSAKKRIQNPVSNVQSTELLQAREPIHVLYGGADRFTSDSIEKLGKIAIDTVRKYAGNPGDFAEAFGFAAAAQFTKSEFSALSKSYKRSHSELKKNNFDAWLIFRLQERILAKLQSEPVEDFRIDFEDGFGIRSDSEEDRFAVNSAKELAAAIKKRKAPPFFGIRIKPLSDQSFDRAIKTLDLFINTLAGQVKSFPQQFVVTLPKVSEIKQVLALTGNLSRLEQAAGLKPGTIGIELMVELPQAIFDASGRPLLPTLFRATGNRCRAVHFGAFDFTAELGISGVFQDINHPACDLARYLARFSLASFNVRFSDSVTTVLPVEIHRRNDLNDHQRAENRQKIFNAWQVHFRNIQRAISAGIYQSWDLHPNQLPARYAAVYSYYLSNADVQASRLKSFLSTAARASLSGNVFDDAASARGVIAFFRRGLDCGAFDAKEIKNLTGLSVKQLRLGFEELLRQLSR